MRVDKKGAIDLVTEIDLRGRARGSARSSRERFPRSRRARRGVLERAAIATRVPEYCWVFDPVDGTTNYAHGLPIFCSSLALEISRRAGRRRDLRSQPARAVHRRARPGRVAERRAAAGVGRRRR